MMLAAPLSVYYTTVKTNRRWYKSTSESRQSKLGADAHGTRRGASARRGARWLPGCRFLCCCQAFGAALLTRTPLCSDDVCADSPIRVAPPLGAHLLLRPAARDD